MGIFRTKKAKDHTVAECRTQEARSKLRMLEIMAGHNPGDATFVALDSELHIWAEWRECRARLENENQSDVR